MTTTPVRNQLRHPWHPIIVHFPIACWIISFALEVLYSALPGLILPGGLVPGAVAMLLLWIGNLTALVAIVAGMIDLAQLPEKQAVMSTVYKHIGWMTSAWALMLGATLLRTSNGDWTEPASWLVLGLEMAGVTCLVLGGLQASRLVYHLHLGKIDE